MASSIRKEVLARRLKAPVQKGYSAQAWHRALKSIGNPSSEDLRLYSAALFLGSQLDKLRKTLTDVPPPAGSTLSKVRRAIGFVNRNYIVLVKRQRNVMDSAPLWADEILLNEIELAGGINTSTIPQAVESLVDGLRFEVAALLDIDSEAINGDLRSVILRGNLSIFYHVLEEQWLDCLHHEYEVVVDFERDRAILHPVNEKSASDRAVAMYRESSLDFEMVQKLLAMRQENGWIKELDDNTLAIRPIGSGKRRKYELEHMSADISEKLVMAKLLSYEPDLVPFLDTLLFGGLSLREMLDVWMALASLSFRLEADMLNMDFIVEGHRELELFAPIESESGLLGALQKSTGFSRAKCVIALEQYMWRDVRDSFWHRPIIRLPRSKELVVVLPALRVPNLRRSIEYWLDQGGVDLGVRGGGFETHLRADLERSIGSNRLLSGSAGVLGTKLNPPDSSIGDFDLVLWIGDTVLVGEVKCLVRPATSHEWFQYEDRISEAVVQVLRKAAYARENSAWFVEALKAGATFSGSSLKVVPCVVLNSAVGALRVMDDVPIVDAYLLGRYLEFGFASINASIDDELRAEKIYFYKNCSEAEGRLESFLRDPEHLRPLRQAVYWDIRRQPDFVSGGEVDYIFPSLRFDR